MAKKSVSWLLVLAGLIIGGGIGIAVDQAAIGIVIGLVVGILAALIAGKGGKSKKKPASK